MTRGTKRAVAVAGVLILAVLGGVGAWAAVHPGGYGRSRAGCITVSMPSSTGGALMHQCGAGARATCRRAFAGHDKISLLTRPQCRLAGLAGQAQPRPGAPQLSGAP